VHMLDDGVIGRKSTDELIDRVKKVETLAHIEEIMGLVVPESPGRAAIGGRRH
jgi:hypothetical protein